MRLSKLFTFSFSLLLPICASGGDADESAPSNPSKQTQQSASAEIQKTPAKTPPATPPAQAPKNTNPQATEAPAPESPKTSEKTAKPKPAEEPATPAKTEKPERTRPRTPLPKSLQPSQPTTPTPSFSNSALFPPTLYLGLHHYSDTDLMLAGMAAIYPGRVVHGNPADTAPTIISRSRKHVRDTLLCGVEYIRCYHDALAEPNSAPKLQPHTSRIIDLRYFVSTPENTEACATFCERLTGTRPRYGILGRYPSGTAKQPPTAAVTSSEPSQAAPLSAKKKNSAKKTTDNSPAVLVLVNKGTTGPIEAMLADLQLRKKIIIVGTTTAGRTAYLEEFPTMRGWWGIVGEIQPGERDASLVNIGVTPESIVNTSPDNDLLAWLRIEKGERPTTLLRQQREETSDGTSSKNGDEASTDSWSCDLILRRAHDLAVSIEKVPLSAATPAR